MKIVHFQKGEFASYGVLEGDAIRVYDGSPYAAGDGPHSHFKPVGSSMSLNSVKLLPPCPASKLVCLGLNYRPHAAELKIKLPELPLLFLKPPSAIIGPDDSIILPPGSLRIDYEGELAVVIGKRARNVPEADFAGYVLGYTCFNDVTDRVAQTKDVQWTRSKSYDTFAPIGPCVETAVSPSSLKIETSVNGEIKQTGNTSELIFAVPRLVSYISQVMTLMPGDVIATGTPVGVGPLNEGDIVEISIEGIGTLKNYVASMNNRR
ncbi:MAG: fumarylacetoacetate hydrolase family protein [Dehalococcoidia bacterium]|jgi:2-keto-4-pentenoate hydratase/2-oxohepta-3-ene-1,7-dioic acid hydratase in catechol pathway